MNILTTTDGSIMATLEHSVKGIRTFRPVVAKNPQLARALRLARVGARLSQEQAAKRLGVSRTTIVNWEAEEGGTSPSEADVRRAATAYEVDAELLLSEGRAVLLNPTFPSAVAEAPSAGYDARPRRRLPPKVYAVVHEYLERLADAGVSEEMIDEAERLMTEFNYSKLHKAAKRERSEEDQVIAVRAIWDAIEITLRDQGVKL